MFFDKTIGASSQVQEALLEGGIDDYDETIDEDAVEKSKISEFNQYGDMFRDLTTVTSMSTNGCQIINMAISYDSKLALAIVRISDLEYNLRGYCLENYRELWKVEFKGDFVKLNIIEQNNAGKKYAVAWQDNGQFYLKIIDQ